MNFTPFEAAVIEALREIRDALRDRSDLHVPTPVAQLELAGPVAPSANGTGNGVHAPAGKVKKSDPWGNLPRRGMHIDDRPGKSPCWVVNYTRPGQTEPLRLNVFWNDWGAHSFAHASTVLRIFRGLDVPENLELLPGPLRYKVQTKIYGLPS